MEFWYFGENAEVFNNQLLKVNFLIHHLNNTMRETHVHKDNLSLPVSMMT